MIRPHIDVGWGKQPLNEEDNEDLILKKGTGAWTPVLFRKFEQSLDQLKQLARERTTAIFVVGGRGSGKSQILRDLSDKPIAEEKGIEYLPAIVRAPSNVELTWDSIENEIFKAICRTFEIIASDRNSNNRFPILKRYLNENAGDGTKWIEKFPAAPAKPGRSMEICKVLKNKKIQLIIALDDLDKRPNADIANFLSAAQTPISEILEHARLLISIRPGQWSNILDMAAEGTNFLVDPRQASYVNMPGIRDLTPHEIQDLINQRMCFLHETDTGVWQFSTTKNPDFETVKDAVKTIECPHVDTISEQGGMLALRRYVARHDPSIRSLLQAVQAILNFEPEKRGADIKLGQADLGRLLEKSVRIQDDTLVKLFDNRLKEIHAPLDMGSIDAAQHWMDQLLNGLESDSERWTGTWNFFIDWLRPGDMKDGALEGDKRGVKIPWPKVGKNQQGELRLNAARKSLNNMVFMIRLKVILKNLSEQSDPVQMPSLHGSTHVVSVEWDSEDWLSILTPTLLLNFFTQVEPIEQEPRNEHSATTAPESSRTKPTKTRYGASRLVGNSNTENMTVDELKERLFHLSANPNKNSDEIRRLHNLIALENDFRLVAAQEGENLPTVTTEKIPLDEVEHINLDAHVKSTGEVEQTEYQPLPTFSIEQSLEKHGLTEDCWLRNTLISTLELTGFDQLPANLDPSKLEMSLELNFFQNLFTKEWLRFSFKKYFKCDDEELVQKINLDDRFSFFKEKSDKDERMDALRRSRWIRKELSLWVQRAKSVISSPDLTSRLVFLEKILTNSTKEFTEEFWHEFIHALGDSTGELALARLAISEFAPPTFCGKLFALASQTKDFPFKIDFEVHSAISQKQMSREKWNRYTHEEKFEAHTADHHGYWDLFSMTNSALEDSQLPEFPPHLNEVYDEGEQVSQSHAGFLIVYEFPNLKKNTFWELFQHLYDYCTREGFRVGIDSHSGVYKQHHRNTIWPGYGTPREWPTIELRIPDRMIDQVVSAYEPPEEWLETGTTADSDGSEIPAYYAIPFQRLQSAYRRAIADKFLNMESTPWQIKISWPELRFELLSPLTMAVKIGDDSLLQFTPYLQHDNHPSNED
ncbi:MAG: hypothetical protein CMF51_01980 [Legionellales bacterium]|nr:hypothetical protein [Legionellales bacterium]